ncbi:GNAT family N-acetyltransferase [Xenophilus azovorans]|uniref:GNAT family N-acetyltransferase n=1 Tax=Xenophilus azovorans TaxID=151755 RepID=UPI00056EBBCF|nr:GNAT family N-acetyltransferase [Xenophilus azovorans]
MRRPARPDDLRAVHAIYVHEAVSPFLAYEPMPLAGFEPLFAEMLASGCFHVWEADGEVAGFYRTTRYSGRASHVAMLGTLAVDPRRHGQGIAQAMIGDAIERLRAEGVRRVELFAESDNPRALRFYARMGFVHEGTLRRFYKRAGDEDFVDEHVLGLLLD